MPDYLHNLMVALCVLQFSAFGVTLGLMIGRWAEDRKQSRETLGFFTLMLIILPFTVAWAATFGDFR